MTTVLIPKGDKAREAINALKGYVYQIYQSALAWTELETEEFLFLEVAEDYAVVAADALSAVQVKATEHSVTINSDDIVASIDSFVDLRLKNPEFQVKLRHLTTSRIGKEKSTKHRVGDNPTLETWRKLAKTGDLQPLRDILEASKLSKQTKNYIRELDDTNFREQFLKRIHFDCGALDSKFLIPQLKTKLSALLTDRGGLYSQVDGCLSNIVIMLLSKATQKEQRFVDRSALEELLDKAAQISVNRAQFDAQNLLLTTLLASATPATSLLSKRLAEPSLINEVPLPSAIANRTNQINAIVSSVTQYGVSWVFGAAGVGKTIGAKMAALQIGDNWASINLRGLNEEQVTAMLLDTIDWLTEQSITGLLIDDFECQFEPLINEKLLLLKSVCDRTDLLLLFTSPRSPSSDFLFCANLPPTIGQKFAEFTENDIQEILTGLGVQNANWVKYIHVISGGGHPQLAIAAIQTMQNNGWDTSEFITFNSLLDGNPAIEQIRVRSRERLLNELPEGGRRLLERLSLKSGSFRRGFVLDMAQISPVVPDGGIVFDRLIGSWVDQHERDRFALSPLLSNLANNTLTDNQKQKVNFEIANSILKEKSLSPIQANSALIAALSGKNVQVITSLCLSVLGAGQSVREMLSSHFFLFTFMGTDRFAYEDDPVVSQMFRGAQLLLLSHVEENRGKFSEVLKCFEAETDRVENMAGRNMLTLAVYGKLLSTTSKFGAIPNFWDLIYKFNVLLESQNEYLPDHLSNETIQDEINGVPILGFMFLNQTQQIKQIAELLSVFEFLNSCSQKLRQKLLKPFNKQEFEVDMLVMGAWLREDEAKTIDVPIHSVIFARLEEYAKSWPHNNLSVSCRKFRAIIFDEYGNDKDQALAILDEGLTLYGETNSELVRAKAKVHYRAADHQDSLELSKILIEEDAPLSKTEKAFLGREAAISAETQGDFETARSYYLYGSHAAKKCSIPDMVPMWVGLMADAALASWHSGDRETCLCDFMTVLQELKNIDPKSSLRAAHCHAVCRHVLLWLDQDVTGEKRLLEDGEETKKYPGIVSNPEPHSEIGKRYLTPIEMAWYMLAIVENHSCLDVGITQNLTSFLPKGPVLEGELILTSSKMRKAFTLLDTELFITALRETIAELIYAQGRGGNKNNFDIHNVTYGFIPIPTLDQQDGFTNLTETFVLCFCSSCIFSKNIASFDQVVKPLGGAQGFKIRTELLSSLKGDGPTIDFNTSIAELLVIHRREIENKVTASPEHVFLLVFKILQIAGQTNNLRLIAKPAFVWLSAKWACILNQQRFLLRTPSFYENDITQACNAEDSSYLEKVINLLQVTLPTLGIRNQSEFNQKLNDLQKTQH
ncbi:MAG: hypothetical protein KAT04_08840 [Methylococcales bacterium]|nr:hypothetical protein [Methylococcales bacterium]